MNNSLINSAMSMQGLQKRMDIISNNVSNLNSPGYKRQEAAFYDVLTSTRNQLNEFHLEGRRTPLGLTEGWGAKLTRLQIDMSQGTLYESELPLDVALEGNAMFEVSEVRRDNDGEPLLDDAGEVEMDRVWTRNGAFRLTTVPGDDENVYLSTVQGRLVRGMDDELLPIPREHEIIIDQDGNITAQSNQDNYAEAIDVGQLKIVRVLRPQMLQNIGEQQFKVAGGVENIEDVLQVIDLNERDFEIDSIAVRQGFMEQSNVSMLDEMTDLITIQRSLQFSAKALQSSDTLMDLTNNIRR